MIMPADISDTERAVIETFADHIGLRQTNIMRIEEVISRTARAQPSEIRDAMLKLADRGWLVANTPLHWDVDRECLLLGEGLRLAQLIRENRAAAGQPDARHGREEAGFQPGEDQSPAP